MSNKKDIAEAGKKDIAVFNPAMMEQDAGQGMENMGTEDLALPFLKVLSGNDPVLDENETARKGDIYNTVTGLFSGLRVAAEAVRLRQFMSPDKHVQKRSGLPMTTKNTLLTAMVSTLKRHTSILFC